MHAHMQQKLTLTINMVIVLVLAILLVYQLTVVETQYLVTAGHKRILLVEAGPEAAMYHLNN